MGIFENAALEGSYQNKYLLHEMLCIVVLAAENDEL